MHKGNYFKNKEILPAVVDFPTPPFPEATTTTCLTPSIGFCFGSPRDRIRARLSLTASSPELED